MTRTVPLNEGRSLNSGDTGMPSAVASSVMNAQRRPESELRRHRRSWEVCSLARTRSTKAGVWRHPKRWANCSELGPLGSISSQSGHRTTDRTAKLPHRGATSRDGEAMPLSKHVVSPRHGLWIENHWRFAISLTGPTACPERDSDTGPIVALQLQSHWESGRRARSRARSR